MFLRVVVTGLLIKGFIDLFYTVAYSRRIYQTAEQVANESVVVLLDDLPQYVGCNSKIEGRQGPSIQYALNLPIQSYTFFHGVRLR